MPRSSSYAVSQWLTCYAPRPEASLRLFCFPHGGGGPHIFRQWDNDLPTDFEMYAVHLPGRGSRRSTPPITNMGEMAPAIAEALEHYLDKPFAFFGHSVGALIAFEVARHMRNNGSSLPVRLLVSAHKAPHQSEEKRAMYTLPDDKLVEVISELGLVPDDALENEELLSFILPPMRADFQVSETYQHQDDLPLPIPITAMGGTEDSLVNKDDLEHWQPYSSVDYQTMVYQGDHFYTLNRQEKLIDDIVNSLRHDLNSLPRSIMTGETEPYPEKCLHELFREQALKTPNELAVVDDHQQLTFKELDETTDLLARYLQDRGVEVDTIVGIYMDSSVEFVIAYLAILKAGGAYMPLETAYPPELLKRVITTAAPVTILAKSTFVESLPAEWQSNSHTLLLDVGWQDKLHQLTLPLLDDGLDLPTLDSLAYCVMTSGTTGDPKGILCPHRGAVNSYYWRYNHTPYLENEREACNIFLVWEVIRPILQGYPAFIIPDETIYDPRKLVAFLEEHAITRVLFTPSLLEQILNTPGLDIENRLSHLHIVWLNGEVVPTALQARFFEHLPQARLLNDYSISECHDVCTHDLADLDPALSPKYAPLGLPMSNVTIYLLDEQLDPVPRGMTAEIYVGGDSLARGYLDQPEKTAERFIANPFSVDESRLFRTGDLGMILPNGHLEVKGRVEFMVKLRGYSIVLGAVETAIIEYPEISTAAVITQDNPETGQPESLVAYIVKKNDRDDIALVKELRDYLKEQLPHYAIPAKFVALEELPLHDVTGKLDRSKLPKPSGMKSNHVPDDRQIPLHGDVERIVRDVWQEILQVEVTHPNDNFFDLGGHSLLAIRMSESLSDKLGTEVSVVDAYEHPTVRKLATFLGPKTVNGPRNISRPDQYQKVSAEEDETSGDIAIIGMACRFPGADNADQFWMNLEQGVCSIRALSDEELTAKGIASSILQNKDYRKVGAVLDGVDHFDPGFWGISRKEAALMDPQHRLFLESCYHAMENAGYAPSNSGLHTGVFGGCYSPTYLLYYLQGGGMTDPSDPAEFHLTETGNDKDYIATRVSYLLNLRGPSITVQTSCSTSAAVVATACQSLLARQCDMALAGASSITFPQGGYQYVEGHINSRDGAVRTFDAGSSGTILGDGVGVVVLKRLADALEAGDSIAAVIKGFSVNNDGSAKAGYSAPSVQGQMEMVELAQKMAGVPADSITLLEAHGTGTLIGDPIEVRALTEVFRRTTARKGFCALGSVKPNIGHSNIAAGMAGLLKTALCLHHKKIVPLINLAEPNPSLNIDESPFYLNTMLQDWQPPPHTPRRAGITSLGIGGTNCHFILEEAPPLPKRESFARAYKVLTLSGKNEESLDQQRQNLADYLVGSPETLLEDMEYTLHLGRDTFDHRLAITCQDTATAIDTVHSEPASRVLNKPLKLTFMFPGQGSQHPRMGYDLYQGEPVFRRYFDRCAELLRPMIKDDLRRLVFAEDGSPEAKQVFGCAQYLQPAIFSLQYAMARTLMTWDIVPTALVGHSIGEYTAACVAEVMTLEDTLQLLVNRGLAMEEAAEGAMLSVTMTENDAASYLANAPLLTLAVINSATDIVLSGPVGAITSAEEELRQSGTKCRRVHVTRAFHSPMLQDAAEKFVTAIEGVPFSSPRIPLVSNVSGSWWTEEQVQDKGYWVDHMLSPVRFAENLHTILDNSPGLLLEVGSHTILRQIAEKVTGQYQSQASPYIFSCLQHPRDKTTDCESFGKALGQIWALGVDVNWNTYHAGQQQRRIALPGYPFDGQSCWKDNRNKSTWNNITGAENLQPAASIDEKITDIGQRGYIPSWARSFTPRRNKTPAKKLPIQWLLFMENDVEGQPTLSGQLAKSLEAMGDSVTRVHKSYRSPDGDHSGTYFLNPNQADEYHDLFATLARGNRHPQRIVDFWTISGNTSEQDTTLSGTYYHTLYLAQAVGALKRFDGLDIWLVTDKLVQVDRENIIPLKSVLFGPALVLPQENPHISCRLLDIEGAGKTGSDQEILSKRLLQECRAFPPDHEPVVAFRGPHRWVQRYEPAELTPVEKNETSRLRRGGVYIITGGMGRIGRTLCDHLTRLQAKIVLTARQDFPSRHRWPELARDPQTPSTLKEAVIQLLAMEKSGAEVMVIRTNMSRAEEVKRLLLGTVERFDGIDGVFHAAGVANLKYLPEINYEISDAEFEPKILGLYNLQAAISHCRNQTSESPDFVLLFSSLASILGGYSMTAYTAANRVMDSFAQKYFKEQDTSWITVNWDDWDFHYTKEQVSAYEQTTAKYAMSPSEGLETLERILASPFTSQVLVATRPLAPRIEQWLHQRTIEGSCHAKSEDGYLASAESQAPCASGLSGDKSKVQELKGWLATGGGKAEQNSCRSDENEQEPPIDDNSSKLHLEEIVMQVYRDQLELPDMQAEDNFFHIGGDSLLASQILSKLRQHLGDTGDSLTLSSIFDYPSVREISDWLAHHQ